MPSPSQAMQIPPDAEKAEPPRPEPLSLRNKFTYGGGQVADSLGLNGVKQIGNTFYVVMLGVSPAWIGTILAFIRIWDAITDPLVGRISDRLVSRHGRRKPLILAGALAMGILFPVLWMASPEWSAEAKTIYFTCVLLIFYVGYSLYSVPFQAMGIELAQDYHQRTGIQAFRTFFGASSNIILWWALPLAFHSVFNDDSGLTGMIWVSSGVGGIILLSGLLPLLIPTDKKEASADLISKVKSVRAGWRTVVCNRSFRLLLGTMGCTFLGINLVYGISGLLNVYYVFGGDVKSSMIVTGWYGTSWTIASVAATPVIAKFSRVTGKRLGLALCILSIASGSLLNLWVFNPEMHYLQLIPVALISPGVAGLWILGPSMMADVSDDDCVQYGLRREATFTSIYGWVQKLSLSASFALSGYITVATGFDVKLAADQAEGVYDTMRLCLALAPLIALGPALYFVLRYPITEEVARENRRILEEQAN
ncbi:MFS transporter [Pelagicoccus sp. SDUM812005]|uniref:MFS transporter n=1 Tax=Pelagicoccus sp. SDUM812005 TaxID=3041257 RepID=UPI00280DFCF2|nr:MFS transporter [Pelagicoccus sp. SDUM812005]MDQ8180254.1 MFS transporter [Pelagicoccus sp. SDUM812005]